MPQTKQKYPVGKNPATFDGVVCDILICVLCCVIYTIKCGNFKCKVDYYDTKKLGEYFKQLKIFVSNSNIQFFYKKLLKYYEKLPGCTFSRLLLCCNIPLSILSRSGITWHKWWTHEQFKCLPSIKRGGCSTKIQVKYGFKIIPKIDT